jgi:hypothetical protein
MAGFSSYLDNKLVDHTFGSGTYTKPSLYLALTVGGVEVSGNGYSRKACAFTIAGNVASLTSNVDFDVATPSGWGTVDGAAIYDAASSGNKLADGTLTASKTIAAGDIFRAPAAGITITLT